MALERTLWIELVKSLIIFFVTKIENKNFELARQGYDVLKKNGLENINLVKIYGQVPKK